MKTALITFALLAALAAPGLRAADHPEFYTWGYSNGRAYATLFGTSAEGRTDWQKWTVAGYVAGIQDGNIYAQPDTKGVPMEGDLDDVIAYLDLFYSYAPNRVVPIGYVLRFARMREDKMIADDQVENTIAAARRLFNGPPPSGKSTPGKSKGVIRL